MFHPDHSTIYLLCWLKCSRKFLKVWLPFDFMLVSNRKIKDFPAPGANQRVFHLSINHTHTWLRGRAALLPLTRTDANGDNNIEIEFLKKGHFIISSLINPVMRRSLEEPTRMKEPGPDQAEPAAGRCFQSFLDIIPNGIFGAVCVFQLHCSG